MTAPFSVRRQMLTDLVARFRLPGVLVPEGVRCHGCQFFADVARLSLETIQALKIRSQ